MAHEIDMTTGKAAVFTVGEMPWHKLGINVAEAQDSASAIKLAGLDWTVNQKPIYTVAGGLKAGHPVHPENMVQVPGRVANVRSDTGAALGVVSTGYKPFQNVEAFDFMDEIVGSRLAMFETAGALKEGRRVWILAKIPQEVRAAKEDVIVPYLLLSNGHDGAAALRMILTSVRVVCANTLSLAMGRASATEGMTIYHFESLTRRVEEARTKFGLVTKRLDRFGKEVQSLVGKQIATAELVEYFESLLPDQTDKNKAKILAAWNENFEAAEQQLPGVKGTVWAALNSVTAWADHQRWVVGKTDREKADNRLNSIWFGSSAAIKTKAYESALAIAV